MSETKEDFAIHICDCTGVSHKADCHIIMDSGARLRIRPMDTTPVPIKHSWEEIQKRVDAHNRLVETLEKVTNFVDLDWTEELVDTAWALKMNQVIAEANKLLKEMK